MLFILGFCLGCGNLDFGSGSGGESDETEAGNTFAAAVTLRVSPKDADTGDRVSVLVEIQDVNEEGILLKIRYPRAYDYYPNSAFLRSDRLIDISPIANGHSRVEGDKTDYLVFSLPRAAFGRGNFGEVSVQLYAATAVKSGKIEVDADLDSGEAFDKAPFTLRNPNFSAESEVTISVTD